MIFRITFDSGIVEYITAKNHIDLLKQYDREYEFSIQEVENLEEISYETAKSIMLKNTEHTEGSDEPKEISVYDLAVGEDFAIIGSTEY